DLLHRLLRGLLGDLLGGLLRDLLGGLARRGLLRGLLHRLLGGFLLGDFLRGHVMALLVSGTCRYYCPVRNTPRVSDPRSTDDAQGASHRIPCPGHPCPAPPRERRGAPRVAPSTRKNPLRTAPRVACIR